MLLKKSLGQYLNLKFSNNKNMAVSVYYSNLVLQINFSGGFILLLFGIGYGLKIMFEGSRGFISTPATVMLSVVPFITGFQLILNAIVLDIQNEPK